MIRRASAAQNPFSSESTVRVCSWRGQKSLRPKIASSDGVRVRPASSVTKIVIARAGPVVWIMPKLATIIELRPTITVAAEAAMTAPIRLTVTRTASA